MNIQNNSKPRPFFPWVWTPLAIMSGGCLVEFATLMSGHSLHLWAAGLTLLGGLLYFLIQCTGRLIKKEWIPAGISAARFVGLLLIVFSALCALALSMVFGPSEDHFADNLKIPEGVEISLPIEITWKPTSDPVTAPDAFTFQNAIRVALVTPGNDDAAFAPAIPSLRRAATEFPKEFRDYVDAAPEWGGFTEAGNRFATRRWVRNGEFIDTLHGYVSEFGGKAGFQTRCLLCLDNKQWSHYAVQTAPEGAATISPKITVGNNLEESRVMIDCGGVWVEIFEQSGTRERRVTKATLAELEKEFSSFLKNPGAAVADARNRSRDIALKSANEAGIALVLTNGMQPGMYGVRYTLNPGEPGSVYLKAFEVTQGTPLSEVALRHSSAARMAWSSDASEKFGAAQGFTIHEGDWGKPYAARFEVWLKPDSGQPERKLTERVFKIEGWQR